MSEFPTSLNLASVTSGMPPSVATEVLSSMMSEAIYQYTRTLSGPSASVFAADATAIATEVFFSSYHQATLYGMIPSKSGNLAFAVLFAILVVYHAIFGLWFKEAWIGISFFIGFVLEVIGFAGRAAAHNSPGSKNMFLIQIVTLTIAPCFIAAGYYYMLGKIVVLFSEKYSILKPMHYSYIYICCDLFSIVLQGIGGGVASSALDNNKSTAGGVHIMLAGLGFQVLTMSTYLTFLLTFLYRVYFASNKDISAEERKNFRWIRFYDTRFKDGLFNPQFATVRSRRLFKYMPLAIVVGTVCVYIRCIYRVIELAQGWDGYLITHEKYVFCLDGMMLLLAGYLLSFPLHPGFVVGRNAKVNLRISKERTGDPAAPSEASAVDKEVLS